MVRNGRILPIGHPVHIHVVYLATKDALGHAQDIKFKNVFNLNFLAVVVLRWRKDHATDIFHAQVRKLILESDIDEGIKILC